MRPAPSDLDAFLLWASPRIWDKPVTAACVRELAWRALAARSGAFSRNMLRPSFFAYAAMTHAADVMRRRARQDPFANLDWSDLCRREREGDWGSLPQMVSGATESRLEKLFGPVSGRHELAVSLLDEVNRTAWGLSLRILWRRFGPLTLILLGTLSAFAVSASIWLRQSSGSPLMVMREWWSFLFGP